MDEHDHEVVETGTAAAQPQKNATAEHRQSHLNRRAQRLEDLTVDALEEPDALRANLKAATAQLLDIGYRMGDEIKVTISSRPAKSKSRQDGAGAVSTLMLVHRQITRYVQLEQQWSSEKTSGDETDANSADIKEGA